jgi:hypothetical protein
MTPNRINDLEGKARDWQWNQWVAEPGIEGVRWCGDTGRLWWQWYSVAGETMVAVVGVVRRGSTENAVVIQ